jgi:hypothetical protein
LHYLTCAQKKVFTGDCVFDISNQTSKPEDAKQE